ncbi:MAG: response regulator transcription factor [Acetatifactor sp.]
MALIYVVEDDRSIQEIETYALAGAGFQVRGFDCAVDFLHALDKERPDLVLLDIMLPDEDGLTVVQKLRNSRDTMLLPVIMVTAKTAEIDKVRGLDLGADDYLTKPFGVMELLSRVKAMLRRSQGGRGENRLILGEIVMDREKHEVTVCKQVCELTYKEYELLKLLLKNPGIVLPRDAILEQVWGSSFEGESRTLDMHIKTLRQKLGDQGSMIRTVRNVGYVIENRVG